MNKFVWNDTTNISLYINNNFQSQIHSLRVIRYWSKISNPDEYKMIRDNNEFIY